MSKSFKIKSNFGPSGDQPQAIQKIVKGLKSGLLNQTLKGVTGSGKTFAMANVIENLQRPAIVMSHNKTLAAQLYGEFKEFFPDNAVEYFVSYYDYYQPEAYVPKSDTYIEKEADINEEIEKLRHASTNDLLTNKEVVIVASVSCIYGLGDPDEYRDFKLELKIGSHQNQRDLLRSLVSMQYERNEIDLQRGTFRVRGDSVEIIPSDEEIVTRIQFWGDEIEKISKIDPLTGEVLNNIENSQIFPAKHWVTSQERLNIALKDIELELEDQLKYLNSHNKYLNELFLFPSV